MLRSLRSRAGSALVFALCLIAVLAIAGIAIVRIAGRDRISAAQLGVKDRGLSCAEAGLQYARRYFGSRYETSNGWNDYLANGSGYRYDPVRAGDLHPTSYGSLPADVKGSFDDDSGADFWVSIRDDDDEVPMGAAARADHDNNETIILRSECINPAYQVTRPGLKDSGEQENAVLEATLVHIQGSSGYATSGPTNAADLVGGATP